MSENEQICWQMGNLAFRERAKPLPAQDRMFMAFVRVNSNSSVLPLMMAWDRGFRAAADEALALEEKNA